MFLFSIFLACGGHEHDDHDHNGLDLTHIIELEADIESGDELYASNCSSCHGANAEGGVGPDLVGIELSHVVEAIQEGVGDDMPAFPYLEHQDISDIFGYIQSL
jgi:menaquinol-cytochrome c reductase cytochrome b/c subunit